VEKNKSILFSYENENKWLWNALVVLKFREDIESTPSSQISIFLSLSTLSLALSDISTILAITFKSTCGF
jgi:hypothetical protein